MRDPRRISANPSKQRRRAVIAVLVMATTPVLADGPQRGAMTMPPLPLNAQSEQGVQSNPFCEDAKPAPASDIRLASGTTASAIRLKPIGAAIGLQPIQDGSQGATRVKAPAMTIESVAPVMQSNPLIGSTHHSNVNLVGVDVDQTPHSKAGGNSRIVLIPPAPKPQPEPVVQTAVEPQPQLAPQPAPQAYVPAPQPVPVAQPPQPVVMQPVPTHQPEPQPQMPMHQPAPQPQLLMHQPAPAPVISSPVAQAPVVVPEVAETAAEPDDEPVYFSLSDRFESPSPATPEPAEVAPPEMEPAPQPEPEVAIAAVPAPASEPALITEVEPAQADEVAEPVVVDPEFDAAPEPVVMDEPDASSLLPIDSVANDSEVEPGTAIYGPTPVVSGPVTSIEETLHTKRYRPPVAVTALPLVFERTTDEAPAVAALQPAAELDLDGFGSNLEKQVKLTPLYLSRAQVRSLTLGGSVRRVRVADKNVCQAFAAGPNQLKLIGTGNGVTRLVVWADTEDEKNPTRMRAFEIHVKDAVETAGDSVDKKSTMLNQSIRKAFPNCGVTVRQVGNELVVSGRCDSEASAKKIMRMVRRTCLVPVKDELVVR